MREILVKEVRMPVPTFKRMPTRYERTHRDKEQLGWAAVMILLPIAVVVWEVWNG